MKRALVIASREYLSFLRTPGFWISLLVMPMVGVLTGVGPQMIARSEPPPTMAVMDLTGQGPGGPGPWLIKSLKSRKDNAAAAAEPNHLKPASADTSNRATYVETPVELTAATTPAEAATAVKAYMSGARRLPDGRPLQAVAVVSGDADHLKVDLWTPTTGVVGLHDLIEAPLDAWLRHTRLTRAGLDPGLAEKLDLNLTEVQDFSPKAEGGKISLKDRLPGLAAVGLSFLLWALVMTGAGILLNTVIEEKANRVMEVLLSSCSVTEILAGKILGGAALSMTMLAFWGGIGLYLVNRASPEALGLLVSALFAHGLIFWFAAFFVAGYLMYASMFAAVGSFCETPREAQTLLGPIMVLLSVPIVFLGASITHPDAPALKILAWAPFFTPFLMTTRVAAGAPVFELVLALLLMVATTVLVVWLSGRAFRSGALASERLSARRFFAAMFGKAD
jgi:ABC-2 type transport system permease protein